MSRKESHSKMENKLVPLSLCCLLQISVWVNFFGIGFTCNLSHSWMSAHCSFTLYVTTSATIYTGFFVWVQLSTLLPAAEYLWIRFCASNICIRNVGGFIKILLLCYFKIHLDEERCQKSVICILPIIFLNLVLLAQLCNFLPYWTESALFIVTLVRS